MNKMKWEKKGLVYGPDKSIAWADNSALQPTPLLLEDGKIRVYTGFRDKEGVSRVGFVDLDANDPSRVLRVSDTPCLDIGADGHFDDNGVVPCSVVQTEDGIYMYYAGYQLVKKVRFLVFGGLAFSKDGETFTRVSPVPIVDRAEGETLFKVIHTALYDGGKWRIWYGGGAQFLAGKSKKLPVYDIRYTESADGKNIPKHGDVAIETSDDEYRIARPYVVKKHDKYHMFLCHGSENDPYSLGYASSEDGREWTRNDDILNIAKSPDTVDSEMMAYPSFVEYADKAYLFYNGNSYGLDGFCYAEMKNRQEFFGPL